MQEKERESKNTKTYTSSLFLKCYI